MKTLFKAQNVRQDIADRNVHRYAEHMKMRWALMGAGGVAVAAAFIAPAIGAQSHLVQSGLRSTIGPAIGYFTPASADPKLSAIYGHGAASHHKFRFTPAVSADGNRSVTVAVRANGFVGPAAMKNEMAVAPSPATTGTVLMPAAYNLGASMGWKKFAGQGESAKLDTARLPSADIGTMGAAAPARKWSTRVQLDAERATGQAPRTYAGSENLSVDVGGSFRLTRSFDVTAGVRYQSERDRLQKRADERRDSQAVYVGTAFRF